MFYLIYLKWDGNIFNSLNLLFLNILQLQNISSVYEISSHFWSISLEWQFYLLFPFILYFNFKTDSFIKYIIILTVVLILLGVYTLTVNSQFDYFILARFSEFAVGLIVGYYYKHNTLHIGNRYLSYFIAFFALFLGRIMITDQVLSLYNSPIVYALLKVLGYMFMSGGFAFILYLSLTSIYSKNNILDFKPLVFIGRISYSFYLWHGLVVSLIWFWFPKFDFFAGLNNEVSLILQFLISILFTTPIAYISYTLFEKNIKYKWEK